MGNTEKIAVNRINICKTEYQTSHINCVEDNSFLLKSLIETVKSETDDSYKITSFKTIIIRENTIYYLKKNGMKVLGKFDSSTKTLNIEVKLTTNISESSNVSTSNFVKTNVEQIRNLKKDDIIDFHLKIKNEDVYEDLGDTKCPDCIEGSSNCLDKLLSSINYNYCASIITCE